MENDLQPSPDEIRRLRARLGLSQTELAERLGVSFATVSRWENGHTKPYHWLWDGLRALDPVSDGSSEMLTSTAAVTKPSVPLTGTRDRTRLDFLADPDAVRAAMEAEWLAYGYLVNPTFATETSLIDPLNP